MESSKVAQLQGSLLVLLGAVTAAMGMPIGLSEEGDLETSDAIFGAVLIVAGLMFLFFGYRLFKAVVFLAGFFFGYWLCYTIMVAINVDYGENEEWIIFGSSMGALFVRRMGVPLTCRPLHRRGHPDGYFDIVPHEGRHLPRRRACRLLLLRLDPLDGQPHGCHPVVPVVLDLYRLHGASSARRPGLPRLTNARLF